MRSWIKDIEAIAKNLTGKTHGSWRANLKAIGGGNSWRSSIRNWAASYGIPTSWWGPDLIRIAKTVTGEWPESWRDALRMLADSTLSFAATYLWPDHEIWDDSQLWLEGDDIND